ncbi:MAG TPA: hypothetical protein VGJ26_01680 [Pirellulales bacterium]|jgi:hypothetical protein
MAIPASKVRAICTESEAALVRASRKSELDQLSHAEVQALLAQARKLFRKWRDLGRGQARARSQKVGFGEKDANTKLKVKLFDDTVKTLEARLAKLDPSASPVTKAPPTKQDRNAEHRATRAAIRKGMTATEDLVNEAKFKARKGIGKSAAKITTKPAAKPAAKKNAVAKSAPVKSVAAAPSVKATTAPKARVAPAAALSAVDLVEARSLATAIPLKKPRSGVQLNPAKQRKAITAGQAIARPA